MSSPSMQVILELKTTQFHGSFFPVVVVTFPASMVTALEILMFNPARIFVRPGADPDALELVVDGDLTAMVENRDDSFSSFRQLLEKEPIFGLTLTTCRESRDGQLWVLSRTALAENLTGRVLVLTGPEKMSYLEASDHDECSPEGYVTDRSFRRAVERAVCVPETVSGETMDESIFRVRK